ncbi:reverse transcriptase family protein [Sphingobacterium multivorum]|uniref:reverse transcriptase family protein n=1 Tax=Sphingobacterium multivorum TaxID=28454 RepID=UPI003683511B
MKIEKIHIEQIKYLFTQLKSKEDLIILLNSAKNMLYSSESTPFQMKSLTYYANPKICKKRYRSFAIEKKSGGKRMIHSPVNGLKTILRSLNFVLQCLYEPKDSVTGFVIGKSIVNNAEKHVGYRYVFNLDLKDFFHSFDRNRVKLCFMYEPFNLKGDREHLAFLLASLCTHPFIIEGKLMSILPQGSPTSPTLTNLLCRKLDDRLKGLAKRFGAIYSRYADDITFSSQYNIFVDEEFDSELKRIILEDQRLNINPKKTRLQSSSYRQETTGLVINSKVNVPRKFIKDLRMWLYFWEKYGLDNAQQIFIKDYSSKKGHVKKMNVSMVNVLDGKLEYLKMVKGIEDSVYKSLLKRFQNLKKEFDPINNLLDVWEKEGIEKAMELFSKVN